MIVSEATTTRVDWLFTLFLCGSDAGETLSRIVFVFPPIDLTRSSGVAMHGIAWMEVCMDGSAVWRCRVHVVIIPREADTFLFVIFKGRKPRHRFACHGLKRGSIRLIVMNSTQVQTQNGVETR